MPLRNLNFDSAIRGVLEQKPGDIAGLLELASAQLVKCKLQANVNNAVLTPAMHTGRRNPERGKPIGSENYNPRAIGEWIENVPETVPPVDKANEAASKEEAAAVKLAHEQLVAVHATLARRIPDVWAKIEAAQKAKTKANVEADKADKKDLEKAVATATPIKTGDTINPGSGDTVSRDTAGVLNTTKPASEGVPLVSGPK